MTLPTTYQPHEVQEILRLAIARQNNEGVLSKAQLLEIAQELDISPDCLAQAEAEWASQQSQVSKREAFALYRQDNFRHKTIKYLMVSGLFLSLDLISGGGLGWSKYVLVIAGFVIAFNTWQTFFVHPSHYERDFEKWEQRQQFRQTLSSVWTSVQNMLSR
ncbi:MAG: 2TM domain-containing protein [Spirulina sp. SIO3F2]|nr:2TM domain-containing protein [Spirulina sp. SIO3F2]